jgi:putative SOS response-associated peptidase YedK
MAMPEMLTTPAEFDAWLSAEPDEALKFQRPLPADRPKIVATGDLVFGHRGDPWVRVAVSQHNAAQNYHGGR